MSRSRYRLTGLGTPWGSLQWERKDNDKEIARRLISLLEDRRMLYQNTAWELPGECIESASRTRERISALIDSPEISPGLVAQLKLLRSYFRTFMDFRDDHGQRYHFGAEPLSVALGELRAKVGQVVGDIAARVDLDVDEGLASIIPVDEGGFLEQVLR